MNMKTQRGFTLIELIIVIVILGILAVTAAPRFIDIQSDARVGSLSGVKGALEGASQLIFAKAAIAGVQDTEDSSVTVFGTTEVQTQFGYPDAAQTADFAALTSFVDLDDADLSFVAAGTTDPATGADAFRIYFEGEETTAGNCYVEYVSPSAVDTLPTISFESADC